MNKEIRGPLSVGLESAACLKKMYPFFLPAVAAALRCREIQEDAPTEWGGYSNQALPGRAENGINIP